MDEQDSRQNTELKRSVVQSGFIVSVVSFMYILTSKFIKKKKKKGQKLSKQK